MDTNQLDFILEMLPAEPVTVIKALIKKFSLDYFIAREILINLIDGSILEYNSPTLNIKEVKIRLKVTDMYGNEQFKSFKEFLITFKERLDLEVTQNAVFKTKHDTGQGTALLYSPEKCKTLLKEGFTVEIFWKKVKAFTLEPI